MRYRVFATDYDGTLATHGGVSEQTLSALRRLKSSDRILVLVTGRELDDLEKVFPAYKEFDYIIAENGALIYYTNSGRIELLGQKPPQSFVDALQQKGVGPVSVGKVIVATWEPHERAVLETIKEAGLEHQVIFNKGAVMILPPGINKAMGLHALLKTLNISMHNTVTIGDAENDSAMLQAAEYAVAVQNALPALKDKADFVTNASHGEGVQELIAHLMEDEHASINPRLTRHHLPVGTIAGDGPFTICPYRSGILLSGVSGAGKSTFTLAILESFINKGYQFCLVDPEGDYLELPGTVVVG
ncbi:MAG: HAD family phosphatase, partial [Bacteroidetes bacterium]|nr:HAD family phosphatase [Bacteroidota bacterium]